MPGVASRPVRWYPVGSVVSLGVTFPARSSGKAVPMHIDLAAMLLMAVVGIAALLFSILYVVYAALSGVGKRVRRGLGVGGPGVGGMGGSSYGVAVRTCPNGRCRWRERSEARYCGQCGTELHQQAAGKSAEEGLDG